MDDREQAIAAAKQRMAAFRLRKAPPTTSSIAPPVKLHARSHSRNNSISNVPISASDMDNSPAEVPSENLGSVPSSPSQRSRPNSHHRRRSSVSTRRESAEMMGVAPPLENSSDAGGDQSELRRLALWALEGKGHSDNAFIGGFTKVEIPELDSPEVEGSIDTSQVPKPKPTLSAFGMGTSLAGKRDSFGKLLISSSNSLKDQLHTLMEEEEEEEEEREKPTPSSEAHHSFREELPFDDEPSVTRAAVPAPSRHRPTNLTLRPLSLTPESLPMSHKEGLPTPSPTPSPRMGGLKSLTLTPSPSPAPLNSSVSSTASRRQSLSVSPSPQPAEYTRRRMSLDAVPTPPPSVAKRKSSISYKQTSSGDHQTGHLPTPGPTPTSPIPPLHSTFPSSSTSSLAPDLERPLSPTEQAFLFRSHASLLCRISDLEQAIAGGRGRLPPGAGVGLDVGVGFGMEELRDRSTSHERPTSIMSSASEPESVTSLSSQPSDEMLQLVSDLKAERDELMRDADGWRTRTADLEKQVATLTRRVEAERREGWVVRERLGLVEVEKKRVREDLDKSRLECKRLEKVLKVEEEGRLKAEEDRDAVGRALGEEKSKCETAEREVERFRREMEQMRRRAEQADADLQALLVTPKVDIHMQIPFPRRFSADSGTSNSSTTDVEEYVPVGLRTVKLNAVEEEEEDRDLPRDVTSECCSGSESDNDELAHYEDDEELDDLIFSDDQTSSSFGSIARSNSHLLRLDLAAVAPAAASIHAPMVLPSHNKTGSMERGWSFPQGTAQPTQVKEMPKVDHFFECLDALDESDAEGSFPTYDSATAKQFWRGAVQSDEDDEDDEMPPFVLPAQPSPPKDWKEVEAAKLEVVAEDPEEEEREFISFRFTTSAAEIETDTAEVFKGDQLTPRPTSLSKMNPTPIGTPTKHPKVRRTSKDMTIPGFKPYSGFVPVLKAPPPPKRVSSPGKVMPTTPTRKLTPESSPKQVSPSLVPQPNNSPPSISFITPQKPRASASGPSFIPRLSTSPRSPPAPMMRTPTKSTITTDSASMKILASTPLVTTQTTTSTPPVFIPQPRMTNKPVTRSSSLPTPSVEPPVLTRLSIPQQTTAPVASALSPLTQGLTAKLSQQMHSLTNFWSPWSANGNTAAPFGNEPEQRLVRGYVSKEQQLQRLRLRLQTEGVLAESCTECASCRDGAIFI